MVLPRHGRRELRDRRRGETRTRPDNIGPPVNPAVTTRAIEWNDVAALERALARTTSRMCSRGTGDDQRGIVLPDAGYHEALRELTREHATLLLIDETHTFCAGPGGYTAAVGLEPDLLTIGKAIAGGIPAAAYGMTDAVAERITAHHRSLGTTDVGGIGGTLAANALSLPRFARRSRRC